MTSLSKLGLATEDTLVLRVCVEALTLVFINVCEQNPEVKDFADGVLAKSVDVFDNATIKSRLRDLVESMDQVSHLVEVLTRVIENSSAKVNLEHLNEPERELVGLLFKPTRENPNGVPTDTSEWRHVLEIHQNGLDEMARTTWGLMQQIRRGNAR